jgi:archaellum component FlaC
MQSKHGKFFEIKDIDDKLEKIESNERKLETISSRVDYLVNLSLKYNQENNEPLSDVEEQVNNF